MRGRGEIGSWVVTGSLSLEDAVSAINRRDELAPREILDALWVRLWLVVVIAAVCAGTAFLLTNRQPRMYEAVARLLYQQPTDVSNPTSSSSSINTDSMSIQLQSVGSTIDGPAARARAKTLLGGESLPADFTVTAVPVEPNNNTTNAVFPNSVDVSVVTTSPTKAARLANAFAAAAIALRKQETQQRLSAAEKVVSDQLKLYSTPQSKLTADYAILTQQLRNLQIAWATTTGDFTIIVPATPPTSPISPKPIKSATLALGLGLIVGIVVAFASSRLDTRVRTHREVSDIVGLPVIGRIPRIPGHSANESDLVSVTDSEGHVSEALRMLRSGLEWADVDGNLKSLLIASCGKGEGKTLTVCNLAVGLARAGKTVVVVEADLRAPRVHRVFNLPDVVGLTSVVLGRVELEQALQPFVLDSHRRAPRVRLSSGDEYTTASSGGGSLRVLTSGILPPDPGEFIASKRMADALAQIAQLEVDYVLVDSPPLLAVGDAGALASSVDGVVLISNVDRARRPELASAREMLDAFPCRKVGVVVVGERVKHRGYYAYGTKRSSFASEVS